MRAVCSARSIVRTEVPDFGSYTVFPRDGYILPSQLIARTERDGVTVEIDVEIVGRRARARRVTVTAEEEAGIGWTALAGVDTRNIVATAVLSALMRASLPEEGTIHLAPLSPDVDADEVLQIVRDAVGYRPSLEKYEGVLAS
jgi:hypothetical protein